MTGILFDLDGTLLNTLDDLMDAVNHTMEVFGYPRHSRGGFDLAVQCTAGSFVVLAFQSYYREHCQIKTAPYPGIMEALYALKKYPMAIVSNKPDAAVKKLCAQYFPGIYAQGEHPGCPRKPSPDMVRIAMEHIGVDRCIYVGDSEVDVLTAHNAAVPCLSVLWGFRDRAEIQAAGESRFCETPAQMPAMLEEMMKELDNGQ